MTENSWRVETPTKEGSNQVISSMINRYLALEFLGPKGIFRRQSSLWMDLEVSKVSTVRRKVILFLKESKPLN